MSENGKPQITPGDGWIPGCFMENRNKFTAEELIPYEGKYVAWSLDGTMIIASAADEMELVTQLDAKGVPSTHYVVDWIDNAESFWEWR